MFKRALQAIDLAIGFSEKAQRARLAAGVRGIVPEVMYGGGLDVRAQHIQSEFQKGKPPFTEPDVCVLGRIDDDGSIRTIRGLYDPSADVWHGMGTGRPERREDADLWIREADFADAFERAAKRPQN